MPLLNPPDTIYPEQTWMRCAAPDEVGFSSDKLKRIEQAYRSSNATALMIIRHGLVAGSWGEIARRFRCHSIRKSLIGALYGIHAAEGRIDLQATLAELGIDDDPPLTEEEKQARVIHLLQSRSGIYHEAAYEDNCQKETRPARGSHPPGRHYWYNNWDFNALNVILEHVTGHTVFEDFKRRIADPLQMEELRPVDMNDYREPERSRHPAGLFRMSARDLGRFGLLYLRRGRWKDHQVIPSDWVGQSTSFISGDSRHRAGLCWWMHGPDAADGRWTRSGVYYSSGWGGHYMVVFPSFDLIIVNRTETFAGKLFSINDLWDIVLEGLETSDVPPSMGEPLQTPPPRYQANILDDVRLSSYVHEYASERFTCKITYESDRLRFHCLSPMQWTEYLLPQSSTYFRLEDSEMPVYFELDTDGRPMRIRLEWTWQETCETLEAEPVG